MYLSRKAKLLLIISVISILSGCGFKDIDKRYFVVAMGIDRTEDEEKKYRISVKIGIPSLQIEAGSAKTKVVAIDTSSISEGLRMLKAYLDKEIDFGHCNIFLLGESIANDNVRESIEWMARRRDIQQVANLAIASPNAEEIIAIHPDTERFPGNTLFLHFSTDATESSYTFISAISDTMRRLNEKGLDPFLPIVRANEDGKAYVVDKVALLDKEKIKLTLEPNDTQLLHQLLADKNQKNLVGSYSMDNYVMAIQAMKLSYRYKSVDPEPKIAMKIKQDVIFEELPQDNYNVYDPKTIKELQDSYSADITALLNKIKEAGVDPVGFGLRYRTIKQIHNFEAVWPSIYETLQFEVNTKIEIRGTGQLD